MTEDKVLEIISQAVRTVLLASAAPLLIGLVVGIIVSIFQAVTSIQEATLAFVPKIVAVLLAILIFGSFMGTTITEFIINLYSQLPDLLIPV